MGKRIFLVRHCEAEGQPPEAQLTETGLKQADILAEFLSTYKIDRLLSSPFVRAIQSIQPLSEKLGLEIEVDNRLAERTLSHQNLSDWFEKLKMTFEDLDLAYEGGESSQQAIDRIVSIVKEGLNREEESFLIVTHGNLMALLLHHIHPHFGFEQWRRLSNPDVYLLEIDGQHLQAFRIWKEHQVS